MDFKPWTGNTSTNVSITTGVYQITISGTVSGSDTSKIQNDVITQATTELGNLSQFDYGMYNIIQLSNNHQSIYQLILILILDKTLISNDVFAIWIF